MPLGGTECARVQQQPRSGNQMKTQLIKWGVAASSLVMLVAATGAGRKFN